MKVGHYSQLSTAADMVGPAPAACRPGNTLKAWPYCHLLVDLQQPVVAIRDPQIAKIITKMFFFNFIYNFIMKLIAGTNIKKKKKYCS